MKANPLPAIAGWRWLRDAYALYRRAPALLTFLVASYWLIILLIELVPVLGVLVAFAVSPVLNVGIMNACREVERGKPVLPIVLFSGRTVNLPTLLILGAFYLACTLGAIAASSMVDGGHLMQMMLGGKGVDPKTLEEDGSAAMLTVTLIMLPVMMAWWFAPLLAAWHRLPLAKSLFFSFVAFCVNWRPFLAYAASLFLVGMVFPSFVLLALSSVMPGGTGMALTMISIPWMLVFVPVVFVSFYISYRDVFGVEIVDERV